MAMTALDLIVAPDLLQRARDDFAAATAE